ncbi:hypothetical protein Tco_0083719 [Tanacetum coccineum]
MVAYLEKSTENVDFDEIVDFLNANPIRYALTYDTPSHTKKGFANIRRQGKDFSGTVTPLFATRLIQPQADVGEDKAVHEEWGDSMERAATTAASLDVEQDSGSGPRRQDTILGDRPTQTRFERLSKQSNDPSLSGVNTLRSGEDRLKIMELMEIYTKLSDREDASKQGRNIAESDQDEEISFVQEDAETQGRYDQDIDVTTVIAPITTAGVSVSTIKPSTPLTTTTIFEDEDLIISQTLMKIESGTIKAVPPSQHDLKDKGKAKMIKLEKPLKKKDQIKFDEEVAKRLAKELEAELE